MAKVPPSEVFTRVFNDSPEFTESESDDENRSVIAKAIEKDQTNASTPTTSADPQPSPQPPVTSVSKPSEEINSRICFFYFYFDKEQLELLLSEAKTCSS